MNARKIAEKIMRANWAPDGPLFERTVLAIQQALIAARDEALNEAIDIVEKSYEDVLWNGAYRNAACNIARLIHDFKTGGTK